MKGWVYVLSNKGKPGLVKVGYSSKDPDARAAELNSTADPHPHIVDYEVLVDDPYRHEQQASGKSSSGSARKSCAAGATSSSRWPRSRYPAICSPTSCAASTGSDRSQSQHDQQNTAHSCRQREGCVRNTAQTAISGATAGN